MTRYAIVIEQGENLHLDGMREDGDPIPAPHTAVSYVELQSVA